MQTAHGRLSSLWLVDFEFTSRPGEPPVPLCVVAHELWSGQWVRRWLEGEDATPLDIGPNGCLVAYLASAEIGCYLALRWPTPSHVLDLFVEHKLATNGLPVFRHGLLDALTWHEIGHAVGKLEKDEMRELAKRGGPYTDKEKQALLTYCETDVEALRRLTPKMLPQIDIDRALFRGLYMTEVAKMESVGVPVDAERLRKFIWRWPDLQAQLGRLANLRYENVFRGGKSFSQKRFQEYLDRRSIGWPRHESGRLKLDDDTFGDMSRARPELRQLREVRKILSRLRLNGFTVGADERNRTMLSPFRSKTGRNQPSNSKFLIGASAWLRHLVKPGEGRAVAYIDYEQQEFAIAAALSGDRAMLAAYENGDPYLALAISCSAAPADATMESHREERDRYKVVMISSLYGIGVEALARDLDMQPANAEGLIRQIRKAFPDYWTWSDRVSATAKLTRGQRTCLGWQIQYPATHAEDAGMHRWIMAKEDRTARNWPVQAAGAEVLRAAIVLAGKHRVRVCAPVHDAVLIEDSVDNIDAATKTVRECMEEAALTVAGVRIRTDCTVVRWPDRYRDKKGRETWEELCRMLNLDP